VIIGYGKKVSDRYIGHCNAKLKIGPLNSNSIRILDRVEKYYPTKKPAQCKSNTANTVSPNSLNKIA